MIYIVTNSLSEADAWGGGSPEVRCIVVGKDPAPDLDEFHQLELAQDAAFVAHRDAFKEQSPIPPHAAKGKVFEAWKIKFQDYGRRHRDHMAKFTEPRPDITEFLTKKGYSVQPFQFRTV